MPSRANPQDILFRMGLLETAEIIRFLVLDTLSTRKLMNLRKRAYTQGGIVYCKPLGLDCWVSDIKNILQHREHIPGKKEARKIRQDRARQNRGNGKSRNR